MRIKEILIWITIALSLIITDVALGMGPPPYMDVIPEEKYQQCRESKILKQKNDYRGNRLFWIDQNCDGVCDYAHLMQLIIYRDGFEAWTSKGAFSCDVADTMWEEFLLRQEMLHGWYNAL